jgi:RHS repeat-associated protein
MDLIDVHDGHLRLLRREAGPADRLVTIGQFGAGPVVELTYATLADRAVHTPGNCEYPLVCPARGGSVVSQHRVATYAAGTQWDAYQHTYRAARMDLRGRGWLGFAEHTVTRTLTGAVTVSEFDNVNRAAGLHVYPWANVARKVTHTVTDRPQGRQSRSTITNIDVPKTLGSGRYTVERQFVSETEEERPVGSTPWQSLREHSTTTNFDAFGNATRIVSATVGGRTVTHVPTLRNDTANWLIGLPTRQVTTACTADNRCTTRTSTSAYNDKGDLIEGVVEPNQPAMKQTTTIGYGPFGVVQSVTSTDNAGQARTQRFEYLSNDRLHATAIINALGHRTQIQTHSGLGVVLRAVDPNGIPVTMRYDGFGRLRETNRADGSFERIEHGFFLAQLVTVSDSAGRSAMTVIDQLGRDLEERVKAFDGRTATVFTEYNPLGRISRTSRPSFSGETRQYTTFAYDNRGRQLSSTAPDGVVVRHEYIGRETHTFDGKDTESYVVSTVDGDIESSFEDDPNATAWLHTRFEYGGFGETTKITGPDGTVKSFRYDRLGRRDRLIDPSTGTSTTTYNAFGEVISETDGSGRTATYTTDLLGRITTTTSPDGTATNTWDTAPKGIGKLATATSADGVTMRHTYDSLGRPATTIHTIGGTPYGYAYGYDSVGRLGSVTYPAIPGAPANAGRLTANYQYNAHGYLLQIKDGAAGGPVYWTAEGRNAAGQLTRERYGNGVVTERDYMLATGLPLGILATGPGDVGRLFDIVVSHDANRNVSSRSDRVAGRMETYGYDTLNRLTSWLLQVASPLSMTTTAYTYDEAGNLKTEQVSGHPDRDATFGYGNNAPPHAVTTRNGQAYGYDGAGRQVSGPGRTIDYTMAGLPRSINWGQGQRTEFAYDPAGDRARKHSNDATVVYAGGLFERRTPAGTGSTDTHNLHNIVADGRIVAQVNRVQAAGSGPILHTRVSYLTADNQGSTGKVSNEAGRPVDDAGFLGELFYDPFGRRTDLAGAPLGAQGRGGPREGFTGHYHDDEYGLINMKGRWYDPQAHRFLTPDPFIGNVLAGQSHNRYSYVSNNPATHTDPTGLLIIEGGDPRSGGPSGVGTWWSGNTSNFLGGGSIPFMAPLTTHAPDMARAGGLSLGGGAGVADDDTAATRSGDNGYKSTDSGAPGIAINTLSDDAVMIGNAFFWQIGDERWALLPGESNPRRLSKQDWTVAVLQAAGGTSQGWAKPPPPVHVGQIGPYKVTANGITWAPSGALKMGGQGGLSVGGSITLAKMEAKAEFAHGMVSHTVTVAGASASAGASVSGSGLAAELGISAASTGSCLKVCTPLIRVCGQVCGGGRLGVGAGLRIGLESSGGFVNAGVVQFGGTFTYEGVDMNPIRAAGTAGYGKFWAVRGLLMGR